MPQATNGVAPAFLNTNHQPNTLNEALLVKLCQQGDRAAQETLFNRYSDRLYRLGYRYLKNQIDTEDLMMMAFVKILNNIKTFEHRGEGSLEGWLRKVVVNEALMWLRKRHNFHLTESLEDHHQAEPDLSSVAALESNDMYQLIAQLPTGYRTVFNLFVIEGYDHREIAEMLEINESTSRSQLFKAKVLLRKMLMQEGFQYGT